MVRVCVCASRHRRRQTGGVRRRRNEHKIGILRMHSVVDGCKTTSVRLTAAVQVVFVTDLNVCQVVGGCLGVFCSEAAVGGVGVAEEKLKLVEDIGDVRIQIGTGSVYDEQVLVRMRRAVLSPGLLTLCHHPELGQPIRLE